MKRFIWEISVRWADLDPNGHVRHSVYYDYGAQARIAYMQQEGVGIGWLAAHGVGPVLFREECRFLRELNYGDRLLIDLCIVGQSADHRKWSLRHRILRGDEVCAILDLDGAWLDLQTRKIVAAPSPLGEKFGELERSEDYREL